MADSCCEIVTEFLLDTCIPLQLNFGAVDAMQICSELAAQRSFVPLLAGSVAEFYIIPMLSYVGDIDVMFHICHELAIPEGTAPPTRLPAEFQSRVEICDITDSEFPGYVYLVTSCLLVERSDDGSYNVVQCEREYRTHIVAVVKQTNRQGPALVAEKSALRSPFFRIGPLNDTVDRVPCIRCLSWPSQAADWPTRHRNYDWPDSATVDRVVSNGCDVVGVAHRRCRQDEWMSKHQWRLSFSRAETVLLNSWTPVQQIVYHMLRYFLKNQQLSYATDNTGAKIFSNYNIKTLMLWTCELNPRSWWTENLNCIRTCVELLLSLAIQLTDSRCQHYFINGCNLFDSLDMNSQMICERISDLTSITETWLAEWFVHNYIHKCAQICPVTVWRLLDNVSVSTDLQKAITQVIQWRLDDTLVLSWSCFARAQVSIISSISPRFMTMTVKFCLFWMKELAKLDQDLRHYFTAVIFLYVTRKTTRKSLGCFSDNMSTVQRCTAYTPLSQCTAQQFTVARSSHYGDESRSEYLTQYYCTADRD